MKANDRNDRNDRNGKSSEDSSSDEDSVKVPHYSRTTAFLHSGQSVNANSPTEEGALQCLNNASSNASRSWEGIFQGRSSSTNTLVKGKGGISVPPNNSFLPHFGTSVSAATHSSASEPPNEVVINST